MKGKIVQTYSSANNKKRIRTSDPWESSVRMDDVSSVRPFTSCNDSLSREVKKSICRYLIENGHDFSVAASPSFKIMIDHLSSGQAPTIKELKGVIFDDIVKETEVRVNDIKTSWAYTGCSVILDEWTDPKGRNMMNVIVDCPKGAIYLNSYDVSDIFSRGIDAVQNFFEVVLREIGISNVVQVITNSTSSLTNEFRMRLTDKFRSVFWTRSASCCIRLMLEKISAIDHINCTLNKAKNITRFIYSRPNVLENLRVRTNGRDLVKRSRIKSAIPFVMLESFIREKEILKNMFLSSDPVSSMLTSTDEGKKFAEIIEDPSFWSSVLTAIKAALPLVRVIDWMGENNKAQMGYINDKIDQAKDEIQEKFSSKRDEYMLYWDTIDNVWNEQLHDNHIHSAGYFFNPYLFYSTFCIFPKVVASSFCFVVRSTDDIRVLDGIIIQLEQYRNAKGCFSEGSKFDAISIPPVEWWSKYGKDCPELQRLAIRVLSQTCDGAQRFQLKRSLAETLMKEKEQNKSGMIYLGYNTMLQNCASGEYSNAIISEEVELCTVNDLLS